MAAVPASMMTMAITQAKMGRPTEKFGEHDQPPVVGRRLQRARFGTRAYVYGIHGVADATLLVPSTINRSPSARPLLTSASDRRWRVPPPPCSCSTLLFCSEHQRGRIAFHIARDALLEARVGGGADRVIEHARTYARQQHVIRIRELGAQGHRAGGLIDRRTSWRTS